MVVHLFPAISLDGNVSHSLSLCFFFVFRHPTLLPPLLLPPYTFYGWLLIVFHAAVWLRGCWGWKIIGDNFHGRRVVVVEGSGFMEAKRGCGVIDYQVEEFIIRWKCFQPHLTLSLSLLVWQRLFMFLCLFIYGLKKINKTFVLILNFCDKLKIKNKICCGWISDYHASDLAMGVSAWESEQWSGTSGLRHSLEFDCILQVANLKYKKV